MDVVIPPGNPHGPDSDSDKENVPPHGDNDAKEGEDADKPPPEIISEPIAGSSRITREEEAYLSDPGRRSRNWRRRM
jgi:hypothetical protein